MCPPGSASPPSSSLDRSALLAALRARLARMEGEGRAGHGAPIPVCDGLSLPGGGLSRAALHEVLSAAPGCGAAFCATLLARTGGTVLWIAAGRGKLQPWPPGLARCGLTPDRLVLVRAEEWQDALWAMEEALRCPAVTGALLAPEREKDVPDLTATRRLQLAAESGGALGLLLRPDGVREVHSAALTRWRVSPLPGEPAAPVEEARWQLDLLRARGGAPGGPWAVRWQEGELALDDDGDEEEEAGRLASG